MNNSEILAFSLSSLSLSVYHDSLVAAAERAKELHHREASAVRSTLADIRELRKEPSEDNALTVEALKLVVAQSIRETRLHKRVRKALLNVRRSWRPAKGERWHPFIDDSKPLSPSATAIEHLKELSLVLSPYLVPPMIWAYAGKHVKFKGLSNWDYTAEHVLAENWLQEFPDLFFGFTVEPPVCMPQRSTSTTAKRLFETISKGVVLSKAEGTILEDALMR